MSTIFYHYSYSYFRIIKWCKTYKPSIYYITLCCFSRTCFSSNFYNKVFEYIICCSSCFTCCHSHSFFDYFYTFCTYFYSIILVCYSKFIIYKISDFFL